MPRTATKADAAPKAAAPPRPTLLDRLEALAFVNAWIDEHHDEILVNDGALPDELAQLLDAAEGDLATKLAAIDVIRRQHRGAEATAKAIAASFTQKARVAANAERGLIAWAKRAMEAFGTLAVKQDGVVNARIIANPPKAEHAYTSDDLLEIVKRRERELRDTPHGVAAQPGHPLLSYIHTQLTATLDTKALLADYEAARDALAETAATLWPMEPDDDAQLTGEIVAARIGYVQKKLAERFPGVVVTQGTHLRFY